jgi:putative oxidoreductase
MRMIDFKPLETIAFVALRIVSGLLFAVHGAQKVVGVLADEAAEVGSQIWFGGMIELVGGVLIALGLLTRGAAFVASGTMAVAYIQFHWKGALDERFFPVVNRGELAVVYCFLFLYFAFRKDNPVSIDRLIFGRR